MGQSFILTILKHCATLACGLGAKKKLSILIYHQILDQPDFMRPDELDKATFNWQMQLLARHFNILPLDEALARLKNDSLPPRAITITFDDGYADNLYNAVPILKEHHLTATFFIASGYLNGGRMWNDTIIEAIRNIAQPELDLTDIGLHVFPIATPNQKAATARTVISHLKHLEPSLRLTHSQAIAAKATSLPDNLMLTSAELQALQKHGMEIGGHTVSHPILAKLDDAEAESEIQTNKNFLENLLDTKVRYFAYPNGKPQTDYLPSQSEMLKKCGYQAAFSTIQGVANSKTDYWQLPRFTPWDKSPIKFSLRLIHHYSCNK